MGTPYGRPSPYRGVLLVVCVSVVIDRPTDRNAPWDLPKLTKNVTECNKYVLIGDFDNARHNLVVVLSQFGVIKREIQYDEKEGGSLRSPFAL